MEEYYGTTPEGARQAAEDYKELFNFFAQNHNLILTISDMDDIVQAVEKHKNES